MSELMNFNEKTCVKIPVQTLPREEVLAIYYGRSYTEEQEQQENKDKVTHIMIDLKPAKVKADAMADKKEAIHVPAEVNQVLDKALTDLQDYMFFSEDTETNADTDKEELIHALEAQLAKLEAKADGLKAKVTEAKAFDKLITTAKAKNINLVDKGKVSDELHATFYKEKGLQQSAEIIFNKYKAIINNFAFNKAPSQLHHECVKDEVIEAFTKALKNFDIKKGLKFKTVFWTYAQNAKMGYYNHVNAKKRVSESGTPDISINENINNADFTIADAIEDTTTESAERAVILREVINKQIRPCLDAKENKIIDLLLVGFEKGELATPLNITRSAVYNRIKCIREKLKKYLTHEQIRELMSMTA